MFKYMLVIIVLLQCSRGERELRDIRNELITSILELKKEPGKNLSFPENITLPSKEMKKYPCECQGVFAKALNNFLDLVESNSTETNILLNKLKPNTQHLVNITSKRNETSRTCPMDVKEFTPTSLRHVIKFLRNLHDRC